MMHRLLVAIDDSPPALAAAELSIAVASTFGAQLRFVTVTDPGPDADAILDHVVDRAGRAGVPVEAVAVDGGAPFEVILEQAHEWEADLIVMGRTDERVRGVPYVGSQTEHLLEFTRVPVLVVPES